MRRQEARRRREGPPAWPYAVLILMWLAGTGAIARACTGAALAIPLHGPRAAAYAASLALLAVAESIALFYLLGFLAKSATYLALPSPGRPGAAGRARSARPVVVLYLTAGDFDAEAVTSLLRLRTDGPRCFLLHDDSEDAAARARVASFLERHPDRAGWEILAWHRPKRTGGKAGAVNWVLERLDPRWELLLLCDSDSIAPDADALLRAQASFDDPDVAVVQFRNAGQADAAEPPFQRRLARAVDVFDVFAAAQAAWGYVPFFGHNALLRVEDVRRMGGLTPGFFSDDLDLSVRLTLAGRRILYRRDIAFAERHPADFAAFRRRARKWAFGCMQVARTRLPAILGSRRLPLAHRIGLLEFMLFYPAQALLVLGLLLSHLALPWLAPAQPVPGAAGIAASGVVLLALFAPTLAWAARARAIAAWPALAWSCALVYGGSILATARGVLDGLTSGERPWVPTNLIPNRAAAPPAAWAEAALGLALATVPWLRGAPELSLPASYLFIAVFLLSPLTFAAYRAQEPAVPSRAPRSAGAGAAAVLGLLALLAAALPAPAAVAAVSDSPAVRIQGDRLLVDGHPFQVRGIHYSPWLPGTGPDGKSPYPGPKTVDPDLDRIEALGCNTVLLENAPGWVLERAHRHGLYTIYAFDIAWNDTSLAAFTAQADRIVASIDTLKTEPQPLAWILGHEVPPWVVEELGRTVIEGRLHALADRVRAHDPGRPVGHANWPPTKELDLRFMDLACFNLYPAWPYEVAVKGYGPYLREVLTPLAGGRPLLISEFGLNSLEASEARQAQVLPDCWREIASSRAIGGVVFEWSDEWWKNYDNPIPGKGYWERQYDPMDAATHDADPEEYYGIVRADRTAKPAYDAIRRMWGGERTGRAYVPWIVLAALAAATWFGFGLSRRSSRRRPGGPESAALLLLAAAFGAAAFAAPARAGTASFTWDFGDTLTGVEANDQTGWTVAGAGCLDGKAFGDIAIGAHFYMVGTDSAAGAVYIDGPGKPPGAPWLARLVGLTPNEHFGESIAGDNKDINGDGYPDLAVGAPLRGTNGFSANGSVDLFRGGGAAFDTTRWVTLSGEASNDWFGQSVALGDLDGDGKAEIIVGAPYNDRGGSAAGAVFIYKGGNPPSTTPWLVLVGEAANDQFGWSVAYLGDINGDGYGDIAVGARLHGTGTLSAAGEVYIFYGGPNMDSIPDVRYSGEAKDDWFGNSVAGPGDVDGGGRPDLLVGAPYNDRGGSAAGAAYLFRGEDPPGSPPAVIYVGESANAQLGWTVGGAGDVDGDGFPDMLAGARLQASGALAAAGRIYLYRGGTTLSNVAAATADGEAANDWFGNCVADGIGYFNPGHGAALAGAPYNDAGGSAAGRGYVLGNGVRVGVGVTPRDGTAWAAPRAWPVPSADRVSFRWVGPAGSSPAFQVFDVSGRRVRSIDASRSGGAEVSAAWDLRDASGRRVPAGIYFVAVRPGAPAGGAPAAARFVVLR